MEVIIVPAYEKDCMNVMMSKPNIRLLRIKDFLKRSSKIEIKSLKNKILIQQINDRS